MDGGDLRPIDDLPAGSLNAKTKVHLFTVQEKPRVKEPEFVEDGLADEKEGTGHPVAVQFLVLPPVSERR